MTVVIKLQGKKEEFGPGDGKETESELVAKDDNQDGTDAEQNDQDKQQEDNKRDKEEEKTNNQEDIDEVCMIYLLCLVNPS